MRGHPHKGGTNRETERQRQAGGAELGSGAGCGEVGCPGCREGSVERSTLLEGESSEGGCSLSFGIALLKKGRVFFERRQRERDSQTRGVRESVDSDSGPRSTWWWRRNGDITHGSMWNLIQASRG